MGLAQVQERLDDTHVQYSTLLGNSDTAVVQQIPQSYDTLRYSSKAFLSYYQ